MKQRSLVASTLAALLVLSLAPGALADGAGRRTKIISPAGLGPSYSGLTGAGYGVRSTLPQYGVKAGEFILQPRFFLEGRYSTNFFRESTRSLDTNNNTSEPVGAFMLQLRPGLGLYNPNASKVALELTVDANVRVPFGDEQVTNQTNVGGKLGATAVFLPKGAFSFRIVEEFQRTLWTRPDGFSGNANRNHNSVGPDLVLQPGGRALTVSAGYRYVLQNYDDIDALSQTAHEFKLLGTWKFYPLTRAFIESTLRLHSYDNVPDEVQGQIGNYVEAMPLKAYLGLSGYITERFSVLARAGYGNTLLDSSEGRDNEGFSSFIGMLQLTFRFSEKTALHVGGARDFNLSALGAFYSYIRAYLSFEQAIGDIALLHLDFAWDLRDFGQFVPSPVTIGEETVTPRVSDPNRGDQFLQGGALLDLHISRIFGVTVGYRLEALISDYNTVTNYSGATETTFIDFVDHRIFTSVNLRY